MNILIENAETLEYLAANGRWSKKPSEGTTYPATSAAYAVAKLESVGKFNIVCYIAETGQFVNMDHGSGKAATSV